MTHEFVLALAHSNATLENVGGKGASLARLVNAGLPVPDGFHVTTAAYQQFVAANDLQSRILAALESVDASQPTTLETASRTIYDLFANAPMPQEIADAIARGYADLCNSQFPVAVRSSATAEDLPDLSFAGQQETFLNIQGAVAVQDAVKRCWASLWTPRAIGYRTQHKIAHAEVALAVVVQMLVYADAAGVMFTANPVNGRRDQIVINAAWGLGEAIVGGLVTPDTLVVDKVSGRVIERDVAEKQVMTVRVDGGTEERPVPENLRRAAVLNDDQVAELGRLGALIEHLYTMPMDIEWTLAQNKFAIVQARPITALPEASITIEWTRSLPDPKGKYMRASIVDLMPGPLSPLFATMGLAAISAQINRAISELVRSESAFSNELFVTINTYAYESVSFSGRTWWWMLTKMIPAFPRILRNGISNWRDNVRPRYIETVRRWESQ
ncbi:partial pyruvate, water dikinase, partial [Anaerolineae bacterium]